MQKNILSKGSVILLIFTFIFSLAVMPASAEVADTEDIVEATAEEIGVSIDAANTVTSEAMTVVREVGTLIEIGNTTAEETTIIIRIIRDGETIDQTVQVNKDTKILTNADRTADLSDWIAGDQISYIAEEGDNSGELVATTLKNKSFKASHIGRNGWVKEIRVDANEVDVEWRGVIHTLNTEDTKMVAGLKNPASLEDLQVEDRIRARVEDDGDGDNLTHDAKIIVVLRRGEDLFMRVTRWVVPAEIISISEDATRPFVITAKVLASKFYEEGDVNNLVGAPGTEININVEEKTKLVRRYLGKATIGEFMEGDKIRVVGRLNEETGNLDAVLVKDNSIQRLGVSNRVSEVKSVDTEAGTMVIAPIGLRNPKTGKRIKITNSFELTVNTNDETVIKENGSNIDFSVIEAGDIVRVRGVLNRQQKSIDTQAVVIVTDKLAAHLENKATK